MNVTRQILNDPSPSRPRTATEIAAHNAAIHRLRRTSPPAPLGKGDVRRNFERMRHDG